MSRHRGPRNAPVRDLSGHQSGGRTPRASVRAAAAWVVERTESSLAPSSSFLESAQEPLNDADRRLLVELALGTLRWRMRLDQVIAQASNRPLREIEPALHAPLRVAVYQLLFLDRVPAHAAVNEAVEEARRRTHRGGASFANAVLRRVGRQPRLASWPVKEADAIRRLAIEQSHPEFLVRRWCERFGEARTRLLLESNNRPKPFHLLAFRDRGGREPLAERLIDEGFQVEPSSLAPQGLLVRKGDPRKLEAFRHGDFYIQDEASQAAALIPPPRPGERILDVAAAPGGKSFTLLSHDADSDLTLADVSPSRLLTLRRNLRRLGRELPILVSDASRPALSALFDRVIVDLPCSGTGTLRKHPELKWRITEHEVGRLARRALRILRGAAKQVAEGGLLVAITCSLENEENEAVVAQLLREREDLALVPLEEELRPPLVSSVAGPGLWRILPQDEHDGFSVQVLRRQGVK